jgi:HEAT repeat protein
MASAEALGLLDAREAAEVLLARLELSRTEVDPDPWLRAHCAWRLGSTTQDWVVPRLLLHLRYETDHETVVWLAATLARFGDFAGLDALYVVASGAATQELRDAAASKLAELAREHGFAGDGELFRAWSEGDPERRLPDAELSPARQLEVWRIVRGFAQWQLRGVDDGRFVLQREHPRVAPLLAEALRDENRYVRTHSAQTLERMGARGRAAGPALLEALDDPEIAPQAALALGAVGFATAEEALVERLAEPHPLELRVAAARGLGELGLASSARALDALLAGEPPLDLAAAAACARVAVSPHDAPPGVLASLLRHLTSGEVEPGAPERALDHWLEARAQVHGDARATFEAWRAVRADDPSERVARRAELLAAALPELQIQR